MPNGHSVDELGRDEEHQPLLPEPEQTPIDDAALPQPQDSLATNVKYRLYISHFLSTWNSRVFEFGAVLYLAAIYPGTLLPMSAYAFARGLSAIIFAPGIGQYIDTGNRLSVVRLSIVVQRLAVAASCAVFYLLSTDFVSFGSRAKTGMLVLLAGLACFEKLCSIMNLVSVEKDWVVIVARKDQEALRTLNAQMRRIDLLCKLLGPLFIALLDGFSTRIAILVNFGMNVISVVVEYAAIARVYHMVPELQTPKRAQDTTGSDATATGHDGGQPVMENATSKFLHNWNHVKQSARKYGSDFRLYFTHQAFLSSLAGALLYLTVLSFGSQMVTYLLTTGYTSTQIGVARTLSVVFEVLATWTGPWLMGKIGPIRAGLWFSTWQVASLVAGTVVFWVFWSQNRFLSASGLVIGTIVSRIGLRGFDLCTQLIVQEDVEADSRGAFSSVEAALQNGFELLSYASTMIFYQPREFKYPALISVIAVTTASSAYTLFVRRRRGHLIHTEKIPLCGTKRKGQEEALQRITSQRDI